MTNKKELTQEDLEKANGGGCYRDVESIKWMFGKDSPVKILLSDNSTQVDGKVTKRAFALSWYFIDLYYIESSSDSSVNGWYEGSSFNGNVVSITRKTKYYHTELSW